MEISNSKIIVTGGNGFLGSYVVEELAKHTALENIYVPRSKDYDLRDKGQALALVEAIKPDYIINLAARLGGIGDNRANPASYFYDNLMIGVNIINACIACDVKKLVNIGTVCSYPKITPIPFKEEDLWNGYPEETNAPYGVAKKAVSVYAQACAEQYGLTSVNLLLTNLYGPRDDFREATSHVIPAIIKKTIHAANSNAEEIILWGDGSPSRDFLYVKDAAKGIVKALLFHNQPEPVNLGGGIEHSIKDLAENLVDILNYKGKITWDTSKPNGQPRRKLDISRAEALFQFKPSTSFADGLRETIEWYVANQNEIDALPEKFAVK